MSLLANLSAFANARSSVLDDRGNLITKSHSEFTDKDELVQEVFADGADLRWSWRLPLDLLRLRAFWLVILALLILVYTVLSIFWSTFGEISNAVFGTDAFWARSLSALVAVLLLVVISLIFVRFQNANRYIHATQGKRSVHELRRIYGMITREARCAACGFGMNTLEPDCDGFTRCPECGASWNMPWWNNFFMSIPPNRFIGLSKGERRYLLGHDARGQVFEIGADPSGIERDRRIRSARLQLEPSDWLQVPFVTMLVVILLAVAGLAMRNVPIFATIGGMCVVGIWFVLMFRLIRRRKPQRYVRDQIEKRICPCCDTKLLSSAHPIDAAIVCGHCHYAWDSATQERDHHSRRSVPSSSKYINIG